MSLLRFVDSHLHLWDVAKPWYDLTEETNGGLGGKPFPLVYQLQDHLDNVGDLAELTKVVHISAVLDPAGALPESRYINELADHSDIPFAIVGTLDPAAPLDAIEGSLDAQMEGGRLRGVRMLGGIDPETETGRVVMSLLGERGLSVDAVAHPGGGIEDVAGLAQKYPDVPIIIEHTGWPIADTPEHFAAWRDEMSSLAKVDGVTCKLSGLAMTYHSFDAKRFAPYFDHCLAEFGPSRCMVGTNFPVDARYGTFATMFTMYRELTARLDADETDAVFAATAERVYGL